jgi:succinate dehydrogenase/fumarate reductase flavoprotein subunit
MTEALRLGAAPVQLSCIQLGPWTCPDEKGYGVGPQFASYAAFPYGLMIHPRTGRRFINELSDRKQRADAILHLGSPCIAIADAQGIQAVGQTMERCLKRGVVKSFQDLEELARAYSLPTDAFRETVDEFNSFVMAGEDGRFHKPILTGAKPLTHPPYFAMRLWPKVHYTMGGLRIDTRARVIDLDHRPIRKLFAAGEVVGGVHGACRLGSVAIPECLVFGRIAGQNAAAE